MKRGQAARGAAGLATAIIVLTVTFSIAFFATSYVYGATGRHPSPYFTQIINALLGFLLTALLMTGLATFFRKRQLRVFDPIIDAMERIATGDFDVRLDNNFDSNVFHEVVDSVNKMAQELGRMEQMRQAFISDVSHEIQSPLTSIRGFARALQNEQASPEERRRYLTIIETESTRLSKITDNLLKLASLESEHVKFEPTLYRLDEQIRNLILACEPQWVAKAIDMDVCLEELEITADEDLLSQVWTNLLSNSIKFTPHGGRVSVTLRRGDPGIEFRITDTGIGISDEDRPHVFDRFFKADKSRERSTEGSGLGLSIAKKIVEMHKGTIAVESALGTGTTFTVSLPGK